MTGTKPTTIRRIHHLIFAAPTGGSARWVQGGIQVLIFLNVVAVALETVRSLRADYGTAFRAFEWLSVGLFTIEYIARVASCTCEERFARPVVGRLRYMLTPMALVDLLAIAPAYLPWLIAMDLRQLRALRLVRVFRVLKLGRYSRAVRSLGAALTRKREELAVTLLAMSILLVLASSALFYAEHEAQPESFSSIPASMWWAVTTLTTVGYGDMAPVTVIGKLAAALVAILGLALFALPAGVLASAFVEQVKAERKCPHCGRDL